jgi:hypothetical protein
LVVLSSSGGEEMGWKRSSRQASFVTSASRSRVDYDRARGLHSRYATGPRLAVARVTGLRGRAVGRAEAPESNPVMHVFHTNFHASASPFLGVLHLAVVQRRIKVSCPITPISRFWGLLVQGLLPLIYAPRCLGSIALLPPRKLAGNKCSLGRKMPERPR